MSEFEMGMMVGILAGVWSVVVLEKVACRLLKVRGVAVPVEAEPCKPVEPECVSAVEADEVDRRWDPVCPQCQGVGRVSDYAKWFAPDTPPCKKGCPTCKGTGRMTPPPKKP